MFRNQLYTWVKWQCTWIQFGFLHNDLVHWALQWLADGTILHSTCSDHSRTLSTSCSDSNYQTEYDDLN